MMEVIRLRSVCSFCMCFRKEVQAVSDVKSILIGQCAGYRRDFSMALPLYFSFKFTLFSIFSSQIRIQKREFFHSAFSVPSVLTMKYSFCI